MQNQDLDILSDNLASIKKMKSENNLSSVKNKNLIKVAESKFAKAK